MTQQQLVAPCGMNCALCQAYQGKGLACHACQNCSIQKCENKKTFCFECTRYPCKRLKALDKRYRTKYHMSIPEERAVPSTWVMPRTTNMTAVRFRPT